MNEDAIILVLKGWQPKKYWDYKGEYFLYNSFLNQAIIEDGGVYKKYSPAYRVDQLTVDWKELPEEYMNEFIRLAQDE
jgi:hypothetical protein